MKHVSTLFRKKITPILVSQKTSPFRNPGSATRSVGHVNMKPVVRSLPWRFFKAKDFTGTFWTPPREGWHRRCVDMIGTIDIVLYI